MNAHETTETIKVSERIDPQEHDIKDDHEHDSTYGRRKRPETKSAKKT